MWLLRITLDDDELVFKVPDSPGVYVLMTDPPFTHALIVMSGQKFSVHVVLGIRGVCKLLVPITTADDEDGWLTN